MKTTTKTCTYCDDKATTIAVAITQNNMNYEFCTTLCASEWLAEQTNHIVIETSTYQSLDYTRTHG